MTSIAAHTVHASSSSQTSDNKTRNKRSADMDGVFAALLAKSDNSDAAQIKNLSSGKNDAKPVESSADNAATSQSLSDRLAQAGFPELADKLTKLKARMKGDGSSSVSDAAILGGLLSKMNLPADVKAKVQALIDQPSDESNVANNTAATPFDIKAFEASLPTPVDASTAQDAASKVRTPLSRAQRIIDQFHIVGEKAVKTMDIQLGSGATELPGPDHAATKAVLQASLEDLKTKLGTFNDQAGTAKSSTSDKAVAALTELANQSMKQAPTKEAVTLGTLQPQKPDVTQSGNGNAQAGSDQSHHEQSRAQRQDQRDANNIDPSRTDSRAINPSQATSPPAQTQNTPGQGVHQNLTQANFQNSVDASQAALPSGGTQASTVTTALQVAARAHSDAQTSQPDLGAIAVSIAAKSLSGSKRFDIRLDPPEMGRIDVRLSVDHAGKAQAMLSADNQQTLDLLQRDKTTLERALKEAGLDLGDAGLNFSLKGQDRQNSDANDRRNSQKLDVSSVVQADKSNTNPLQPHLLPIDNARLDIRV